MNAAPVPQTWHRFDHAAVCAVCRQSAEDIIAARAVGGGLCLAVVDASEGGDTPEPEVQKDETTIDPYFLYSATRV